MAAAEDLYRQILQTEPEHADSLHLLGVIAHQRGDHKKAVELINRAINLNGKDPAYRSNLAISLRALNRLDEATERLQQAVAIDPDYAVAHKNLGVTLNQLGRSREAAKHLRRALELAPDDADAYKSLGLAMLNQGQLHEAAESLAKAASLKPDDPEATNNLGVVLKDMGRLDDAAAHLRKAVQLRPSFADAHNNLGTVLSMQRELDQAAESFREALRLDPDHVDALHNLGAALRDLGQLQEGEKCLREAIDRNPGDVEAHNNLGAALQAQGKYDEAMAQYEYVLRANPDHVWAHFNRSTILLASGDFEHGWLEYEWRFKRPGIVPRRFHGPYWDGSPKPDQTLLLYAEQGLGDTLQFVRYANSARQRVGRVIVECQEVLIPLLSRCKGIDRLVAKGSDLPEFDYHAPLMSLPGILRTKPADAPADVPYLSADPELVEQWREQLGRFEGFKVGVNWQGNPQFRRDHHRSMPLACFAPLAEVPGVCLFSLQWGTGREQLSDASLGFEVIDFGNDLDKATGAFMDRAAIMTGLNLLITSDTAIAHLAGAMDMPVWVALPLSPDWRWGLEAEVPPWYPSMRLFRQSRLGDWESVFQRMARRLSETISDNTDH